MQAALLAQVTITSLQTSYLPNVHWVVSAIWTATLVFSLLSVYSSFILHKSITDLGSNLALKKYFSGTWISTKKQRKRSKMAPDASLVVPAFSPSFVAYKITTPSRLLDMAIMGYLLALGLYWLLSWVTLWKPDAGQDRETSRNVCLAPLRIRGIL